MGIYICIILYKNGMYFNFSEAVGYLSTSTATPCITNLFNNFI
jgi:hypothetical protein